MKYIKKVRKYLLLFFIISGTLLVINKGFNITFFHNEITNSTDQLIGEAEQISSLSIAGRTSYCSQNGTNTCDYQPNLYQDTKNVVTLTGTLLNNMSSDQIKVDVRKNGSTVYYEKNITINGTNFTITLTFNGYTNSYSTGKYFVYVYTSGLTNGKNVSFDMIGKYYDFSVSGDTNGTTISANTESTLTFNLANIQGMSFYNSNFEIKIYKGTSDVTTKFFDVTNNISSNKQIIIKNHYKNSNCTYGMFTGYTCASAMVESGTYTINISYKNTNYSNACGTRTKTYTLYVKEPSIEFKNMISSTNINMYWSHPYIKTTKTVYIESIKNKDNNDYVNFYEDGTLNTMLKKIFESDYGVKTSEFNVNSDGNVVYKDEVNDITVTNYYNDIFTYVAKNENDTYETFTKSKDDFKKDYPTTYIVITGDKAENDKTEYEEIYGKYSVNTTNGNLQFVKNATKLEMPETNLGSTDIKSSVSSIAIYDFTITNGYVNNAMLGNAIYRVYKVKDEQGNNLSEIKEMDSENDGFDVTWEVTESTGEQVNRLKYYVSYKRERHNGVSDNEYAGGYILEIKYPGQSTASYKLEFSINVSNVDYYTTSYFDKHESTSDDTLESTYPNSNKKYEYYIGMNIISGSTILTNRFGNLAINIYNHMADKNDDGYYYFYDQVDYEMEILNKKNGKITFNITAVNEKTNEVVTNATSQILTEAEFASKYSDAYNMINYMKFDETTGNIINENKYAISDDNKTITLEKYDGKNVTYLDADGNEKIETANEFAARAKSTEKYTDLYIMLINNINPSSDGTIIAGHVKGYYKNVVSITTAKDIKDLPNVNDEFNIKYNEDASDLNKAITILPKTEVEPGKYYTYVNYGARDSVGYLNNKYSFCSDTDSTKTKCNVFSEITDLPLNKIDYPEMYNQNIHRVEIEYSDPLYEIDIENNDVEIATCIDENGNLLNQTGCTKTDTNYTLETLYTNAIGTINIPVKLKYIYDIVDNSDQSYITYTITNSSNDVVSVDKDNKKYFDITNPFTSDTTDDITQKNVIVDYNGNNLSNGIYHLNIFYKGKNIKTYDFNINKKYYNILFEDKNVSFAKNYGEEKEIVLDEFNTDSTGTLKFSMKKDSKLGYQSLYTKDNNIYYDEECTEKVFEISTIQDVNKLNVALKYVENSKIEVGTYILTATYQETDNIEASAEFTFTIAKEKHIVELKDEKPYIDSTGMHYVRLLGRQYIKDSELDYISYKIKNYNEKTYELEDVSTSSSENKMFNLQGVTWNGNNGYIDYLIDESKVSYNTAYDFEVGYNSGSTTFENAIGTTPTVPIQNEKGDILLKDIYVPKYNNFNTIGKYAETADDGTVTYENVDGFYKNLPTTISADLDTVITSDVFKYVITTGCVDDNKCSPMTAISYNELFDKTITTDDNGYVSNITLEYNDPNKTLPVGKLALVIYYNNDIYNIKTFEVKNKYVYIDLGNAELKTYSNISESGLEEGLFADAKGYLKVPATIKGISFDEANITITKNGFNGGYINYFTIDKSAYESDKVLLFNYNGTGLTNGTYQLKVENSGISDTLDFIIQSNFINFVYKTRSYSPDPLIPNGKGKVTYHIETENIVASNREKIEDIANMVKANVSVTNYTLYDVTNLFEVEVSNISGKEFDLTLSFDADTLDANETYYVTSSINYNNTTVSKQTTFTVGEKGLVKQIIIYDMVKSNDIMYADQDGYYLFNMEKYKLDGETLYAEIYDEKNNIVYSDFMKQETSSDGTVTLTENVKNFAITTGDQYRISIIPFKSRVGKYTIKLFTEDKSVVSNTLEFQIDQTKYNLKLTENSYIKSKVDYQDNKIYNLDGIKGYYEFTTDYDKSDSSVFSIKVFKDLTLVKEISGLDFSNLKSDFEFNEFKTGTYEIAMCINGLPYDSKYIDVLDYVKTSYLSLNINGSILSSYSLINGSGYDVKTIINPSNATNKNFEYVIGNNDLAEYKNGVLFAKGVGETTFTVKNSEKSYTVTLKINNRLTSYKFKVDNVNKIIYVPYSFINSDNSLTYYTFLKNLNGLMYGYQLRDSNNKNILSPKYVGTGMKFYNVYDTFDIVLYGDANGDGKITSKDYVRIKNHIMETSLITNKFLKLAADANLDGKITSKDYVRIKNIIMNGAN